MKVNKNAKKQMGGERGEGGVGGSGVMIGELPLAALRNMCTCHVRNRTTSFRQQFSARESRCVIRINYSKDIVRVRSQKTRDAKMRDQSQLLKGHRASEKSKHEMRMRKTRCECAKSLCNC